MKKKSEQNTTNKTKSHHFFAPSFGFVGVVGLCALNGLTWLGCGFGGVIAAGLCYAGVIVVDKLATLIDTLIETLNESKAVAVNVNAKLSGLDSTLEKINSILDNFEEAHIIENVGQRVVQLKALEDQLQEIVRHIHDQNIPHVDATLENLAAASGKVNEQVLDDVAEAVRRVRQATMIFGGGLQQNYQPAPEQEERVQPEVGRGRGRGRGRGV